MMESIPDEVNAPLEEKCDGTTINDLPDEILENIFSRLSPYTDLEALKYVSKRFNGIIHKVVTSLKANFEQSIRDGRLQCEVYSPNYNESGKIVGSWISERFGHMCCYYDRVVYVVGGTAHTPTTFNDMWKFDLGERKWSRCLASGQYPTPKALASFINYKDNLVLFGGWSHPSPYPLMQVSLLGLAFPSFLQHSTPQQPWRIFDELHIFNVPSNRWTLIVSGSGPHPSAGHSVSIHQDLMMVFGGRNFDQKEQSYPISKNVWVFDFIIKEWFYMETNNGPESRYGQTQVSLDETNALVVGGCGGPNRIFSDVWLLSFSGNSEGRKGSYKGIWTSISVFDIHNTVPNDFHYSGCKIGSSIVFCERSSPVSPFFAFLHFDSQTSVSSELNSLVFESSQPTLFHSRCSGLRQQATRTMPIYSLDISKVLIDYTADWSKEPIPLKFRRPCERLLYSMVSGRSEMILFGGFYKEPNGVRCRVSNNVFILKTIHKSY